MDQIKDAFQKVKGDISSLKEEFIDLKEEISLIQTSLSDLLNIVKDIKYSTSDVPTDRQTNPTNPPQTPAFPQQFQHINQPFSHLKGENKYISTGNGGVPTDRQTDQQTDIQHIKSPIFEKNDSFIDDAAVLFDSLDNVKKEIRLKLKRLTDQEIAVFSTIYQLDEEFGQSDYKSISMKLNLTESSIRDYVGKLIKKGIPVDKKKINNKQVVLTISPNLKKIASLSTILKLREL